MRKPVNTSLVPGASVRLGVDPEDGGADGRKDPVRRTTRTGPPREEGAGDHGQSGPSTWGPATFGCRGLEVRRAGTAPRRSELRRSGDYSGPSAFSGAARNRRTPAVRCRGGLAPPRTRRVATRGGHQFRRAVGHPGRRGIGQDSVLTRRIAWQSREGVIDPAHVLAVTFTRKAAGELRARLARLGVRRSVTAGTFHAIALAQLRRRAVEQGRAMPALLERKVRLLVPLLPSPGGRRRLQAAEIASEIEWAKARMVRPRDYEHAVTVAGRATPPFSATMSRDLRGLRAREAQARPRRLRRPDLGLRRRARTRRRLRRRATLALPSSLRRRVPGRQRRPVPAAARVARRTPRPVRRRRRGPGDLRLRRSRSVVPGAVRRPLSDRALPRGHHGPVGEQLPLHTPGGGGSRSGAGRRAPRRGASDSTRRADAPVRLVRDRRR